MSLKCDEHSFQLFLLVNSGTDDLISLISHEKPLKDVARITEILNLCAEKMNEQEAFIEPLCELIKLFG